LSAIQNIDIESKIVNKIPKLSVVTFIGIHVIIYV